MTDSFLQISNLKVDIDGDNILSNLNIDLAQGEITSLMGQSGCGKTSLLRTIAGFLPASKGKIKLDGKVITNLSPEKRKIGMVFQDYALFPHITVHENVCFGCRKIPASQIKTKCSDFLDMLNLTKYADQYPHELSGGQQQKIAIARALMPNPQLVLMDEPFSNLDPDNRDYLVNELYSILAQQGTTALVVTHEQNDAYKLSNNVAILNEKKIVQFDDAYTVYHQPKNKFVADFVGKGEFIQASIRSKKRVECALGILTSNKELEFAVGTNVELLVRPEDVIYNEKSNLRALIVDRVFRGFDYVYRLQLEDKSEIMISINSHTRHKIGDTIGITPKMEHVMVYPITK